MIVNVSKSGKVVGSVELQDESLLYALLRTDLKEAMRIAALLEAELAKQVDPKAFELHIYVACPVCGNDRRVLGDGSITECQYCAQACLGRWTKGLLMDEFDDSPDLGPCCACGKEGPDVRNIIMLPRRARVQGTGWGCIVCDLPNDGASVVVCDACLADGKRFKWAVDGYMADRGRIPIENLPEGSIEHDLKAHAEFDYMGDTEDLMDDEEWLYD